MQPKSTNSRACAAAANHIGWDRGKASQTYIATDIFSALRKSRKGVRKSLSEQITPELIDILMEFRSLQIALVETLKLDYPMVVDWEYLFGLPRVT